MAEHETTATKAIAELMANVDPGTPRFEALNTARRFKTSWIDLGGTLHKVRQGKLFKEWGYPSFESYCSQEIRIKPRTAAKLTASYNFLREEEPSLLKRDGVQRSIPDPAAIEVLRKARTSEEVDENNYRRIKEMALDDETPAKLRKELRSSLPAPEPKPPQVAMKKLVDQANRLADSMATVQGIPRVLLERVLALVDDLRKLVEH